MPPEEKEVIETQENSIEDDMSALFDEIQGRDEEETEKPERARGPDGKFAKADETDEKPVEKAEKTEKVEKDTKKEAKPVDELTAEEQVSETKETEKPAETIRPPSSWSAAAKAKFAAMDPDLQKEVLKREDDFHNGIDGYKTKAKFADAMYKEIQPYEAMIRSQGSTPEASIRNLLGVAYQLSTGTPHQKQQVIASIAQMYGVEMPQSGEEMQQMDPTVQALQQQIQQLMQEREQEKHQRETSTTATLSDEIEAFKADPKNLYFENVRAHMSALLQGGRATGLQDAYDQAIWANPEVRQQLLAQQAKEAEAARLEAQKKEAIDAKRSAGINTRPKSGIASAAPAGQSITDTMEAVFNDIQSR